MAYTLPELMVHQVAVGLAASVVLALESLRYSLFHGIPQDREDATIDGAGLLHTIWLYRNHSELKTVLEQVEDSPTDQNLREAGKVGTTFAMVQVPTETRGASVDLVDLTDSNTDLRLDDPLPRTERTPAPSANPSESSRGHILRVLNLFR
ncbi:hypothetical protein C8J57DRAFT_1712254 [Mycena rebaudengoi]|nr:hypothetical protein C8J57DRAFT_1712254 [Mycena rebaudengoi]